MLSEILKTNIHKINYKDKEYYFDSVREKLLPITKLETLKEHIISYLVNEKNIPNDMLSTLRVENTGEIINLGTYDKTLEDVLTKPLVTIAATDKISDALKNNIKKYAIENYINFFVVIDYNNLECFCFDKSKKDYVRENNQNKFIEKIKKLYKIPEFLKDVKLKNFKDFKNYFDMDVEGVKRDIAVSNLQYSLYYYQNLKTPLKSENIEILLDLGCRLMQYYIENFPFWSYYKKFLVKYNNSIQTVSIGIDYYCSPLRPNVEYLSLFFGINHENSKALHLLISFDDYYIKVDSNQAIFSHDFRIPMDSSQKNNGYDKEFEKFIRENMPNQCTKNNIVLGKLQYDRLWNLNDNDVQNLILNIIKYGFLREEYRLKKLVNRNERIRNLKFDFEEINNLEKIKIGNKEYYFDPIRKFNTLVTPEETVRQKVIRYLIDKLEIPKERIFVEEALVHYNIDTKDRADIIINNPDGKALVVIECKAPEIILTEEIKHQLKTYCKKLSPDFAMLTNGWDTRCYYYDKNKNKYLQMNNLPQYIDMLNDKYETSIVELPLRRMDFQMIKQTPKAYVEIGEDTPIDIAIFCENFWECLLYSNGENLIGEYEIFEITKDRGVNILSFGNAGGGLFQGRYHSWDMVFNNKIYTLSIGMSTYSTHSRPDYMRTAICVGIEGEYTKHHALQLVADQNMYISKDEVKIYHHGAIAIGNIGSGKKAELRDIVKKYYPKICSSDNYKGKKYFYLGKINNNKILEFDNLQVKEFFENLVSYAILRDEYRKIKKQSK